MKFSAQFTCWKHLKTPTWQNKLTWQDVFDNYTVSVWHLVENGKKLRMLPTKAYIEVYFAAHHHVVPWKRLYVDGTYDCILESGEDAPYENMCPSNTWRTGSFEHIEDACVAWMLAAKKMGNLVKDVQVLIARAIWHTRYNVEWNALLFARLKQQKGVSLDTLELDGGAS
jgi:hypothetical protein